MKKILSEIIAVSMFLSLIGCTGEKHSSYITSKDVFAAWDREAESDPSGFTHGIKIDKEEKKNESFVDVEIDGNTLVRFMRDGADISSISYFLADNTEVDLKALAEKLLDLASDSLSTEKINEVIADFDKYMVDFEQSGKVVEGIKGLIIDFDTISITNKEMASATISANYSYAEDLIKSNSNFGLSFNFTFDEFIQRYNQAAEDTFEREFTGEEYSASTREMMLMLSGGKLERSDFKVVEYLPNGMISLLYSHALGDTDWGIGIWTFDNFIVGAYLLANGEGLTIDKIAWPAIRLFMVLENYSCDEAAKHIDETIARGAADESTAGKYNKGRQEVAHDVGEFFYLGEFATTIPVTDGMVGLTNLAMDTSYVFKSNQKHLPERSENTEIDSHDGWSFEEDWESKSFERVDPDMNYDEYEDNVLEENISTPDDTIPSVPEGESTQPQQSYVPEPPVLTVGYCPSTVDYDTEWLTILGHLSRYKGKDVVLTLDGEDMWYNENNGSFEIQTPLVEGKNTFILKAENSKGETDEKIITVTRREKPQIVQPEYQEPEVYASAIPQLSIGYYPMIASSDTVTITGKVNNYYETDAQLTVNGASVFYDPANGYWEVTVSLVEGENILTIIAENSLGEAAEKTIVISY